MKFRSTRGNGTEVTFLEAVLQGLAPDGGLFHPSSEVDLSSGLAKAGELAKVGDGEPFSWRAARWLAPVLRHDYTTDQVKGLCERAFPFEPRLRTLDEGLHLLELFHGPSCAFKDFGAGFLSAVMEEYLERVARRALVLTATSGDTGSAVAQAFAGRRRADVVVLYPKGRVSRLQEQQLTTVGGNVTAVEVEGSFDDCQRLVKESFAHREAGNLPLTSANSINLGRLIPQVLYYMEAVTTLRVTAGQECAPVFSVPSGNFGNLTAGVLAWRWGMPAQRFLAATNRNDVVPKYLETGRFNPRPSVQTLSNAMDVGNPSNFERLATLFGHDVEAMRKAITGIPVSEEQTSAQIRSAWHRWGTVVCPHTAVGLCAAQRWREEQRQRRGSSADGETVVLATAHPGKFPEIIRETLELKVEIPERLARLLDLPNEAVLMEPDVDRFVAWLKERYGA